MLELHKTTFVDAALIESCAFGDLITGCQVSTLFESATKTSPLQLEFLCIITSFDILEAWGSATFMQQSFLPPSR